MKAFDTYSYIIPHHDLLALSEHYHSFIASTGYLAFEFSKEELIDLRKLFHAFRQEYTGDQIDTFAWIDSDSAKQLMSQHTSEEVLKIFSVAIWYWNQNHHFRFEIEETGGVFSIEDVRHPSFSQK